jgi:hypothetical protein
MATYALGLGGSDSYLVTTAEQLERLGHEVVLYAFEHGDMAQVADRRGLRLARDAADLPDCCDALVVQDAAVSYALAERYPDTPQLFRAASHVHDLQLPPQLPGVVAAVVALSELVADRMRALAIVPEVVRLRHPIDTERFAPLESIPIRPRRALLLGNYLRGRRKHLLMQAFGEAGIDCRAAGLHSGVVLAPEDSIAAADIVVAKGRAALEGMAGGRAVYVYDVAGSDGWVTPESYTALEADNFAGTATDDPVSADRISEDLRRYAPEMGVVNRDLVVAHHDARQHAHELVELMRRLGAPEPGERVPYDELSRLVRLQWRAEGRVQDSTWVAQAFQERLLEYERQLELERNQMSDLRRTRRWRLAAVLGGILDRLRGN